MNNRNSTTKSTATATATATESLNQQEWEAICNRCGLCCYEKVRDHRGIVISTPIPCQHLNLHSHECKVYNKRFTVGENCQQLTPETVDTVDWLPEQCAYRKQQAPLPPVKKQTEKFRRKKAIKRRESPYYQDDSEI